MTKRNLSINHFKKDVSDKQLNTIKSNLDKTMSKKVTIDTAKLRTIVDKAIENKG